MVQHFVVVSDTAELILLYGSAIAEIQSYTEYLLWKRNFCAKNKGEQAFIMCLLTFIVVDIDSLFVTHFYTLPQHPPQQIRHALGGLDGGDHEEVGVHVGEVYVVSGVADKLC